GMSSGSNKGQVTKRNVCTLVAPSIAAASYTARGIIFKPTFAASIMNGNPYHIAASRNTTNQRSADLSQPLKNPKGIFFPKSFTARASQPVSGLKIFNHRSAPIISGIAQGRIKTACQNLPNFTPRCQSNNAAPSPSALWSRTDRTVHKVSKNRIFQVVKEPVR